ncbi:MAG: BON domain-containing protein [Arenicella sp.]
MMKIQLKRILHTLTIAGSMALISACAELAIATVAITTVDIIHDRRTTGEYFDDSGIELEMKKFLLSSKRLRSQTHINTISYNGILLLTGEVNSEALKQEVADYANRVYGVRQVVDEVRIAGKTAFLSRTSDTWITSKVKTALLAKMKTKANQMKVVTEYGTVYLMGIVTEEEANRATEIARSIGGVVRVVRVFEIRVFNT